MKNSRKLLISAVALVISLAVSVSTTFAWFTISANPSLGKIDLQVKSASEGMYISMIQPKQTKVAEVNVGDQEKAAQNTFNFYKTSYSNSDVTAILDGGSSAYVLLRNNSQHTIPVADALLNSGFKMRDVTFNSSALYTPAGDNTFRRENDTGVDGFTTVIGPNTGEAYVSFSVYFLAQNPLYVYLDVNSKVGSDNSNSTDKVTAWKSEAASTYGTAITAGQLIEAQSANAARIGFISSYNATNPSTLVQSGTLSTTNQVWEPNSSSGYSVNFDSGSSEWTNLANDYRNYYYNRGTAGNPAELWLSTATMGYLNGHKNTSTMTTTAGALITQLQLNGEIDDGLGSGSSNVYYTAKVTVNIWIEGWDGDCFNSILDNWFTTNLQFVGEKTARS